MNTVCSSLVGLTLFCCAAGCAYPAPTQKGSTVVVPGFRVKVSYSDKASLELKRRGETIVIFGYLFASPTKVTPRNIVSDMGEIGLGDLHAEVQPKQMADLPTLRVDQQNRRYMKPEDVRVLINVASGRKSSPDNLLACDIYEGRLQKVQSRTVPIHCKLIGE